MNVEGARGWAGGPSCGRGEVGDLVVDVKGAGWAGA